MRALILCAGEGRRLRPLTQIAPKPLARVAGEPMVVRQILSLRRAGVTEIVINAAHGARILMAELGDGARWGVRIAWSVEGLETRDALETRGGVVRALPLLGSEPFLAVAGDIVTDMDYCALAERARSLSPKGALAHLALVANPSFHAKGDFGLENGLVRRPGPGGAWTYSSLAAFHPALFAGVPEGRAKLFPWMLGAIDAGRVTGEVFRGLWANVGTLAEMRRAEAMLASCEGRAAR